MARTDQKEPGRLKQMWQVFQMTRRGDKRLVPYLVLVFVLPILVGIALGFIPGTELFAQVLWIIAGVVTGLLLALVVLGRRAEKVAYAQIEGQPGAVGAVLRSSLRRGWRGSEMPVAVNPKTRDAVYRAVGRGGVVLISEGVRSRNERLIEEQRRRVQRVAPNVAITILYVGPDPDSLPLAKIPRALTRIKTTLTKAEVLAVDNRLASLQEGMPVPKGIDPLRVRAPRQPR